MCHSLLKARVLQVLNCYIDDLSRGNDVTTSKVEFFVEEDKQLKHIVAELPSYGSLGPLFYAFGLITADELSSGVGAYHGGIVFPPFCHMRPPLGEVVCMHLWSASSNFARQAFVLALVRPAKAAFKVTKLKSM